MSGRTRNESGESRRNVVCGICGHESRRDNMKFRHFPKKHPGQRYIEQAEKTLKSMFFKPREIEEDTSEIILPNEDVPMDVVEVIPVGPNDAVLTQSIVDELVHAIKNNIHDEIEPLRKKLDDLTLKHQTTEKATYNKHENSELASGVANQILMIRASRSIEDLCIYGELTMYRHQNKLTCDMCEKKWQIFILL